MSVVTRDVKSLSKSGDTKLKGDVTLSAGTNVSLTQSGQNIEIAATGGGAGSDTTAIHDNIASEISAITEKVSPASTDLIIIEDSADSNSKKKIQIGNLPTGGGGEANTASNQGVAGAGVFYQKSGIDLQFKNVNAGSSKITITDDTTNHEIDVDVDESALTLSNIGGSVTDSQVPDTITLTDITQITNRSHTD